MSYTIVELNLAQPRVVLMPPRHRIPGDLLTVEQVADLLQLNKLTIYKYIHSGELVAVKLGRSFRVRRDEVEHFLDAHMVGAPGRPAAGRERVSPRPRSVVLVPARGDTEGRRGGDVENGQERRRREALIASNPLEWIIRGLH